MCISINTTSTANFYSNYGRVVGSFMKSSNRERGYYLDG